MITKLVFVTCAAFTIIFYFTAPVRAEDEVERTVSIQREGFMLEFPEDSLACKTKNMNKGRENVCNLAPPSGLFTKRKPVVLTIYSDTGENKRIAIRGEIDVRTPIAIRYANRNEHSEPFLELKANALKGLQFKSLILSIPGPFQSTLEKPLPGIINIKSHDRLFSTEKQSTGSFVLAIKGLQMKGLKVALPGTQASQEIVMQSPGWSILQIPLNGKQADLISGTFETRSSFEFGTPQTLSAYGLKLPVGLRPMFTTFQLSITEKRAMAILKDFAPGSDSALYEGQLTIKALHVKHASIGAIESILDRQLGLIQFSESSSSFRKINISGDLALADVHADQPFLEGTGTITLESFLEKSLSGDLNLSSITQYPHFGPAFSLKAEAIRVSFSQTGLAPMIGRGSITMNALRLGPVGFGHINTPINFSFDGQGSTAIKAERIRTTAQVVPPLSKNHESETSMIEGIAIIDRLSVILLNIASDQRRLQIAPSNLQFRFDAPSVNVQVAGGQVKVDLGKNKDLVFVNERIEASRLKGLIGAFTSNSAHMTVPALQVVATPGNSSFRIGTGTLSADAAFFRVDLQDTSASPFGLTGSFTVKGLHHKFDAPTKIRINDAQLTTSSVDIQEVTLSVNLVRAKVSIKNFALAGGDFEMVPKSGKTEAPQITGVLSSSFTIALAEAELPFTSPVELFNLDVRNTALSLKNVSYVDPGKSKVLLPTATFSIGRLGDEEIDAVFEAIDGRYTFNENSLEFNGLGALSLDKIRLELKGPRKPLKGSIELALRSISLIGSSVWKPMKEWGGYFEEGKIANPDYEIPLKVEGVIPELSGRFAFEGEGITGALVSHGQTAVKAVYLGPPKWANKWEKNWLFQSEVRWRSEYPCGGTWQEPIRTCEAWGVLLPQVEGKLRWNYVIGTAVLIGNMVDFHVVPKREVKDVPCEADPDLCPGGSIQKEIVTGFKQCRGTLVPGALLDVNQSLYPDLINDGGEIAKWLNATSMVIFGVTEKYLIDTLFLLRQIFTHNFLLFGGCP